MASRRWGVIGALVLTAVGVAPGTPGTAGASAAAPGGGEAEQRYIVVLADEGLGERAIERRAEAADVEPVDVYEHALTGYSADLTGSEVVELRDDPRVDYVAKDVNWSLTQVPPQSVPTGVRRVFGPQNPHAGIGGPGDRRVDVDIAVIDGGVNNHEDLHVVDRVDCLVGGAACEPGGFDETGHGTHVAGSAAAINNGFGVVGTAPGARVWSQRVCSPLGWVTVCPTTAIVAAIDYVTAHADQIEVANMSLGGTTPSPPVADAITRSVARGVTYVVAAGNDNVDAATFQPANHPDVITVSALADADGAPGGTGGALACRPASVDDQLADYSNWGATVEVAAPGTCITSTARDGHGYAVMSGTSMAAPHVAGAAALLTSGDHKPVDRAGVLAVHTALTQAGNLGWTHVPRGPGDTHEPLLDVHDGAVFTPAMVPATAWDAGAAVPGTAGTAQFADAQCAQDPNGYYLFAGMPRSGGQTATSWRYDLVTDTWAELAPYPGGARIGVAAACTPDGKVHVIGGTGADHHVYDIATGTWASATPLPRDTFDPAVGAWGGKVVVAGGQATTFGTPSAQVDVYDVATGTWSAGPALPEPIARPGFARVGSALYLAGGWGSGSLVTNVSRTLRLDMAGGTWVSGPAFPSARADAALVATGTALYAVGGFRPDAGGVLHPTRTVERLDLAAWPGGTWTALPDLPTPLAMQGAACASTGPDAVLAAIGGSSINEASPAFRGENWQRLGLDEHCASGSWGAWPRAGEVPGGTARYASAQCAGDRDGLYKVAGYGDDPVFPLAQVASAWHYESATDAWTELAPTPAGAGAGGAAVCTADGRVHVIGPGTSHHVYDPATNTWAAAAPLPRATVSAAVGTWQGKVYVLGGVASVSPDAEPSNAVDVYDVATGTWSTAPPLPEAAGGMGYAQAGRYLYLAGGRGDLVGGRPTKLARTLRYDMQSRTFSSGPALSVARSDLALVATDTALYAIAGHRRYEAHLAPVATVERLALGAWPSGSWGWFEPLPRPLAELGGACLATGGGATVASIGGIGPGYEAPAAHWRSRGTGESCPA
jgi:subtilisin family serine protease/N-acetylneuraminic acid mutarotase